MRMQKVGPSFGMAMIKDQKAEAYINSLPDNVKTELKTIESNNAHVAIDAYFTTRMESGEERLIANVGHKKFLETRWISPEKMARQAMKFAKKLWEEQVHTNELTKGMNIPRL